MTSYDRQGREVWLATVAAEGGITVEQLLSAAASVGQHPEPCFCDWLGCDGWMWSKR